MPSFIQNSLPDGLTRYATGGGAISAPSENLGFYFSGVHAPSGGVTLDSQSAANTLITVKMPTMSNQTWSNNTLPDNIPGRFNAELVWIPVSQSGVLIAIGGVLYSASLNLTAEQVVLSVSLFAAHPLTLCSWIVPQLVKESNQSYLHADRARL
jgi:hypothetical protein